MTRRVRPGETPAPRPAARGRRRAGTGRGLLAAALTSAVLVVGAAPGVAATEDDAPRADDAEITTEMLRESVRDLSASADAGVRPLVVDGAVTGLERTGERDGATVVALTSDLLFDFGAADLTPAASTAVQQIARELPTGAAVGVAGHTDSLGGDEVNVPLSQRRAQAVADALLAVRPDLQLTVTGHGSAEPVAAEQRDGVDDPGGRALNRRVELVTTP